MTLRQLYYQLVARGYIENNERSYNNLIKNLVNAREAGVIPWDAFEDRARSITGGDGVLFDLTVYDPEGEATDQVERAYTPSRVYDLPRWYRQPNYVECWIEKDALAGVVDGEVVGRGIHLITSRGQTSYTFKQEARQRFSENGASGKNCILLYFGDLDPSGWCISEVLRRDLGNVCEVQRVALNVNQVENLELPPSFQKESDPNTPAFRAMFPELGDNCYELDALPPDQLQALVAESIDGFFDQAVYVEIQEEKDAWYDQYEAKLEELKP